ncbi:unnamed protein product [Prorocentrum cordatum]|uniref:Uncharacterized protein n=1 Tax=Prorocentrum cordatum TaxID=2364126 RepID=A0ABN9PTT7_9DINO|nr:unnamed protein product [Polarella glacialis]
MAGGGPRAKEAVRQDWTCKTCVSKRGRAVVNWGTALKCQACRLPKHACFGANVPLPLPGKATRQPAAESGKAPPWAGGPPLAVQLAQAQWELQELRNQLKGGSGAGGGGPQLAGAQDMVVDDGAAASADDAALAAEINECEAGLQALKDVAADWAKTPRDELRARTHAIANKAKQCAERMDKADGAMRKAKAALQRAQEALHTEQAHAELLALQAALQPELAALHQQAPQVPPPRAAGQATASDVIGGPGIAVGELEAIMRAQLAEHPGDEQPVPAEARKRMAGALGERLAELQRRAGPAAEAAAGEGHGAADGRAGGGPSPAAAAQQSAAATAGAEDARPRQPRQESLEQLQLHLQKIGLEHKGDEEAVRARCAALARGGPQPHHGAAGPQRVVPDHGEGHPRRMIVAAGVSMAPCFKGLRQHSDAAVLLVQEHNAKDHDRLATLQHATLDHGDAGARAAAAAAARGSDVASGGAAAWARTHVVVADPPFLDIPVLAEARPVAAHVRWGVAGGPVAISAYLREGVGWNEKNQRLGMILVRCLARLNAAGLDWVVGGDFNMSAETFPMQLVHDVRGLRAAPDTATCRPRASAWSTIGYFLCAANLAPRPGKPQVLEVGTQHRLSLRRSRRSAAQLPVAWDAVVEAIDQELLGGRNHAGAGRAKYVGRRARHAMGVGAHVANALRQLHGAGLLCTIDARQHDKLAAFLLEAGAYMRKIAVQHRGIALLPHWIQAARVVEQASGQHEEALKRQQQAWAKWADDAFSRGAGQAHRGSKVRDLQEVVSVWHGEQQPMSRPVDIGEWEPLPELTVEQLRQAAHSFPCSTAIAPAKIGMQVVVAGARRGVQGLAAAAPQRSVDIWGLGAGRSSSEAAFALNLETEVAVNLQEQVITVPMDARKFFETVVPAALPQEARQPRMPLPLARLLLELCRQPVRLQAFGSVSYDVVSAPVDDVTLQRVGEAACNNQPLWAAVTHSGERHAGSRGLQRLRWARNLDRDPGGRGTERRQTKLRPQALARRRGRLAAPKRAAGRQAAFLRRTALLPSAGHGAGATGIMGDELRRPWAEANRLAGARPATMARVAKYASWIWEQRTSPGRPLRARAIIMEKMIERPSRASARGSISSTTLTLWRIGWRTWSSTALVADEEQHVQLLTTSPSDLKAFLFAGVGRWQGRRIMGHFAEMQPLGPLWLRALRLCAGIKGAVRLADSATRLACGEEDDTPGHRHYGCEALLLAQHGEEEQSVLPGRPQEVWASMRDEGSQLGQRLRARGCGATGWGERRGDIALTDGSGLASSMPELRRRGWPLAQLGANAAPVRAAFGALPGPLQTAGRAERGALLRAAQLLVSQVKFVAANLLALAREAGSQGEGLEQAGAAHTAARRRLRRRPTRPNAFWIPAHKDVQGHLELGARQHAVAQVYVDVCGIEAQHHKEVAACIGWATQRCLQLGERQQPPAGPAPRATAVEHALVDVGGRRGLLGRGRGRRSRARPGAALQQPLRAACEPSRLARIKSGAEILHLGARARPGAEAGARAVAAPREAEGDGGDPPLESGRPWHDTEEDVLAHEDHRLRRAGPAVFCEVCAAWMQTRAGRGLQRPCQGPPRNRAHCARTYVSNLGARRDKLLRSLDTKAGRPFGGAGGPGARRPTAGLSEVGCRLAGVYRAAASRLLAAAAARVASQPSASGSAAQARTAGAAGRSTGEIGTTSREPLIAKRLSPNPPPSRSINGPLELGGIAGAGDAAEQRGGAGVLEAMSSAGHPPPQAPPRPPASGHACEASRLLAAAAARAAAARSSGAASRPRPAARFAICSRRPAEVVAKRQPREPLPRGPPRPTATACRLARWARWWIAATLTEAQLADDWRLHCVPYVEAALGQPRRRALARVMGRTAKQLARDMCDRAWARGGVDRRAFMRYRRGLSFSQAWIADSMRRHETEALRRWLADPGRPPGAPRVGWAPGERRRPRAQGAGVAAVGSGSSGQRDGDPAGEAAAGQPRAAGAAARPPTGAEVPSSKEEAAGFIPQGSPPQPSPSPPLSGEEG